MKSSPAPASTTKRRDSDEQPLIDDVRLLGRILGDVIREQEGEEAFALVEKIRTLSVSFRRDADHAADRALKNLLKGLSAAETVRVIRAFTYFSHLANLAEDRHQIRRRTETERKGESAAGSLEMALARIRKAGITPQRWWSRWRTATCRRCSLPIRPKCSARAFSMPSVPSRSC